jgi:hypothetical protein
MAEKKQELFTYSPFFLPQDATQRQGVISLHDENVGPVLRRAKLGGTTDRRGRHDDDSPGSSHPLADDETFPLRILRRARKEV